MQITSFENFKKDIYNIREYIEHIKLINNIAHKNRSSNEKSLNIFIKHLASFHTEKKIFEYKSIIISLYGILENTISKWIEEHIQNVSYIVKDYNKLEDSFKNNHFNLSIKLISLIIEKKHSKFENINKNDILTKLNAVIQTSNDFELNSEAYIPLSGNLKHVKVIEAFKPLDIDLTILKNTGYIDDLVTRRNSIAHGVKEQIDALFLGISEFEDFISALEQYMTNIFNIICEKENEYDFKHNNKNFIYIDEPKKFFQNNQVCIINIKDIELKVGDILFIEKNDKFSQVTIIDIQKDDKSTKSANEGELGLKVDNPIKKNSKIWKKLT
jgi:hypothetical protein